MLCVCVCVCGYIYICIYLYILIYTNVDGNCQVPSKKIAAAAVDLDTLTAGATFECTRSVVANSEKFCDICDPKDFMWDCTENLWTAKLVDFS